MESTLTSSPNVRLHISIKDKKTNGYTEVLRGTSKGYEIVEVDGLVFRRKRTELPDNPKETKRPRASEGEALQDCTPALDTAQEVSRGTTPRKHSPQAAASGDRAGTEAPAQSEKNIQDAAEAQQTAGQTTVDIDAVAMSLLRQLPQTTNEGERLLAICDLLASGLGGYSLHSLSHSLKLHVAQALQDGTLMCQSRPDPNLSQAKVANDKAKTLAALQNQLATLQQEESDWSSVLREGEELSTAQLEAACNERQEENKAETQPCLRALQKQSHAALSFQVEGLSMMMTNVEQLLSKAENQCRLMQVEYHKEKFLKFPHVDSPARLIHEIVRDRRL